MKKDELTLNTDNAFVKFEEYVLKYIKFFNLLNWELSVDFSEEDTFMGSCEAFTSDRFALIRLAQPNIERLIKEMEKDERNWKEVLFELERIAFHEVLELLLYKLREFSLNTTRIISPIEIDSEIHSIIRTLENTILPMLKDP